MAAVTFDSKLNADGSLLVPEEAIEALGARPGEALHVRVETANGTKAPIGQRLLSDALVDLLAEAERFEGRPGLESSDATSNEFGDIVKEKYRRLGLDV